MPNLEEAFVATWTGFPVMGQLVGSILGKMGKNSMKITKSSFWAKQLGGHGR